MSLETSELWRYDVASRGETMKFVGEYKIKIRIPLRFPAGTGRDFGVSFSDGRMDEGHGTNRIGAKENSS